MKVACIQPEIFENKSKCYSEIKHLLNKLLKKFESCNIVCLPERWLPLFRDPSENFQKERGEAYFFIKDLAKLYNIKILSGGIWEQRHGLRR